MFFPGGDRQGVPMARRAGASFARLLEIGHLRIKWASQISLDFFLQMPYSIPGSV